MADEACITWAQCDCSIESAYLRPASKEVAGAVVAKGPDCPRRRVAIGGDTDRLLAGVLRCDGRLGDAGQSHVNVAIEDVQHPETAFGVDRAVDVARASKYSPALADRRASLGDLLSVDLADHEVDQEPGTRFVGCWSSSKGGDPRERGVDESAALPDRARLARQIVRIPDVSKATRSASPRRRLASWATSYPPRRELVLLDRCRFVGERLEQD